MFVFLGLQFISQHEARKKAMEEAYIKEQEKIERENMKMSVPGQAIPMGYIPQETKLVKRTRSFSLGHQSQVEFILEMINLIRINMLESY